MLNISREFSAIRSSLQGLFPNICDLHSATIICWQPLRPSRRSYGIPFSTKVFLDGKSAYTNIASEKLVISHLPLHLASGFLLITQQRCKFSILAYKTVHLARTLKQRTSTAVAMQYGNKQTAVTKQRLSPAETISVLSLTNLL